MIGFCVRAQTLDSFFMIDVINKIFFDSPNKMFRRTEVIFESRNEYFLRIVRLQVSNTCEY